MKKSTRREYHHNQAFSKQPLFLLMEYTLLVQRQEEGEHIFENLLIVV